MDKQKYKENNIDQNLKNYLKEIHIINARQKDVVNKCIEETTALCEVLASILEKRKNGDIDLCEEEYQSLDDDIISAMDQLILIIKLYKHFIETIMKDYTDNSEIDMVKNNFNLLIGDRIRQLEILI